MNYFFNPFAPFLALFYRKTPLEMAREDLSSATLEHLQLETVREQIEACYRSTALEIHRLKVFIAGEEAGC